MYIEATVIVDGAEEEFTIFENGYDTTDFDDWLDEVKSDFAESDSEASVYIIEHQHPMNNECACVQYLSDHKPLWSNK